MFVVNGRLIEGGGAGGRAPADARDGTIQFDGNTYVFDGAFGPEASQKDVFEGINDQFHIVDCVMNGHNVTILMYGETSSGKSHTSFGTRESADPEDAKGILHRALGAIFDSMKGLEGATAKILFWEVYNEQLYDLIPNVTKKHHHKSSLGSKSQVKVRDLTALEVNSYDDAIEIFQVGCANREVSPTEKNDKSSRSHAVFVLQVQHTITKGDGVKCIVTSRFSLADLAGSEKPAPYGKGANEATKINSSILHLGNLTRALVDHQNDSKKAVPQYRNSTLTYMLQESFGGNNKTCIVGTIRPDVASRSKTKDTLDFLQRAKEIKNEVGKNESQEHTVSSLLKENELLRGKIARLESRDLEAVATPAASSGAKRSNSSKHNTNSSKGGALKNLTNSAETSTNSDEASLKAEIGALNAKVRKKDAEVQRSKQHIIKLEKNLGLAEQQKAAKQDEFNDAKAELQSLREQLKSAEAEKSSLEMVKEEMERLKAQHVAKIEEMEGEIDQLRNQKMRDAYLASQKDAETKCLQEAALDLRTQLASAYQQTDKLIVELNDSKAELRYRNAQVEEVLGHHSMIEEKNEDLQKKYEDLQMTNILLRAHLNAAETEDTGADDVFNEESASSLIEFLSDRSGVESVEDEQSSRSSESESSSHDSGSVYSPSEDEDNDETGSHASENQSRQSSESGNSSDEEDPASNNGNFDNLPNEAHDDGNEEETDDNRNAPSKPKRSYKGSLFDLNGGHLCDFKNRRAVLRLKIVGSDVLGGAIDKLRGEALDEVSISIGQGRRQRVMFKLKLLGEEAERQMNGNDIHVTPLGEAVFNSNEVSHPNGIAIETIQTRGGEYLAGCESGKRAARMIKCSENEVNTRLQEAIGRGKDYAIMFEKFKVRDLTNGDFFGVTPRGWELLPGLAKQRGLTQRHD
eukprot:scaffold329_cov118-Skeletonema_menzelii.AAC.7